MATCQTSQWVSKSPYVHLEVTQKSSTSTTVTLAYALMYLSDYGGASTNVDKDYSVTIDGKVVASGKVDINGVYSKRVCEGTVVINKGSSAKNISFGCSFAFNLTWSGSYAGTKTASGSISIPAIKSYTVSYNANGGSGAPGAQTKYHGETLIITSTKPTRSSYKFLGWSKSATSTSVYIQPGGNYTSNESITLYAVWQETSYTVVYNANGGSGAPTTQTKSHGVDLTISPTKPTRTGYVFQGWGKSATTTTVFILPGAKYTYDEDITLYAIWKDAYVKPKISNLVANRYNANDKTIGDAGTSALVTFNWSSYDPVTSIKIRWKEESSTVTTWNEVSVTASGTSGSVSQVIGGNFDVEKSYAIGVVVTDSDSSERYTSISGQIFPIDFLGYGPSGRQGAAVGKPAEFEDTFDVNWLSRFRKGACTGDKTGHLDGKQGVYIDEEGFIQIQRTTAQAYHPYIAFLLDAETAVAAQIRCNATSKALELMGTDILLQPSKGEYRPYYRAGDTISISIRTAGYVTSSSGAINFVIPLSKPVIGNPTVSISSVTGLILRQLGEYTHGSAAGTAKHPSSYTASMANGGYINVIANVSGNCPYNNATIGIDASVQVTFS